MQSKKFIAFLFAEVRSICTIALLALYGDNMGAAAVSAVVTVSVVVGFIEAGYIGGQAWLDRYIKLPAAKAHAASIKPSGGGS